MSHTEVHSHLNESDSKKEIWKITAYLSILTIIELILGFIMMGIDGEGLRLAIKGVIVILMIAKAFYIVAYFMHLKHELKSLIMTIVTPLALFIWFIGAFLYDGSSYKNLRNTYDPYKKTLSETKVILKENHSEHH